MAGRWILQILALLLPASLASAASYFTYEGFLTENDLPVTQTGLPVQISINGTNGGTTCQLYQESHSVDVSDGAFVVLIGNGTSAAGLPFEQIFSSSSMDIGGGSCVFDPAAAGAFRSLSIWVNGTSLGSIILTDAPRAVAAGTAEKIAGQKVSTTTPSNGQILKWNSGTSSWTPAAETLTTWSSLSGKPSTFPPDGHSHYANQILSGSGIFFDYRPDGTSCAAGQVLKWQNSRWECGADNSGSSGSVTSVGLAMPSIFSVTNSPVTSSGNLTVSLANQPVHAVLAGPLSGGATAPVFRSLQISDIRSSVSGAFLTATGACPAGQALTYLSASDTLSCQSFSLTAVQVTDALGFNPVSPASLTSSLSAYLPLAGGTMSGVLNLPSNGLRIGGDQFTVSSGNIGIGTTTPSQKLDVVGSIKGTQLCIGNDCRNAWPVSSGGSVTSVTAGTGLLVGSTPGGTLTTAGTLNVDTGTSAGKIVQLDASARLPSVDGSALTNLSLSQISSGVLGLAQGGTGQTSKAPAFNALSPAASKGDLIVHNGTSNVRLPAGTNGQVLTADSANANGVAWSNAVHWASDLSPLSSTTGIVQRTAAATYSAVSVAAPLVYSGSGLSLDTSGFVLNGGNSVPTAMSLGTNSSHALNLETGGITRLTIDTAGNVGIGTNSPAGNLHLSASSVPKILLESTVTSPGTAQIYQGSTNQIAFRTNSGQIFNMRDDGQFAAPSASLTGTLSAGSLVSSSLRITTGAAAGRVLASDASGNATWTDPDSAYACPSGMSMVPGGQGARAFCIGDSTLGPADYVNSVKTCADTHHGTLCSLDQMRRACRNGDMALSSSNYFWTGPVINNSSAMSMTCPSLTSPATWTHTFGTATNYYRCCRQ